MAKKTGGPTEETTTALTKREAIAGALAVAEGAVAGDARGKTNIDASDRILPRLAIAQDLSPQRKEERPEFIEGLRVGDMFNTLTGEIYGRGPLEFVILDVQKRAMEFDDDNNVVDFDVKWDDPRCLFTNGPDGKRIPPVATRFYDFIILLQGEPGEERPSNEMVVLSLKRTQMPIGKKLISFMSVRPGAAWMGKYSLGSFMDHKGNFSFGNFKVALAGPTLPVTVAYADAVYKAVIEKGAYKIDRSNEDGREPGDETTGEANTAPTTGTAGVADDDIPF